MPNNEDTKTELIRRIWRLVGERGEVVSKRHALRGIVGGYDLRTDDAGRGLELIDEAVHRGLVDVDALIMEALTLLAKLDAQEAEEAANDEPDEGGDGEG